LPPVRTPLVVKLLNNRHQALDTNRTHCWHAPVAPEGIPPSALTSRHEWARGMPTIAGRKNGRTVKMEVTPNRVTHQPARTGL